MSKRVSTAAFSTAVTHKKAKENIDDDSDDEIDPMVDWHRPALQAWDHTDQPVQFQQIEIDHYINIPPPSAGAPGQNGSASSSLSSFNSTTSTSSAMTTTTTTTTTTSANNNNNSNNNWRNNNNNNNDDFDDADATATQGRATKSGQREAVLRIYGVNMAGNSVCAHVHGFYPYLYVRAWDGMDPQQLTSFVNELNKRLLTETREKDLGRAVLKTDVVKVANVWQFQHEKKTDFIRITLALPSLIAPCQRFLQGGVNVGNTRREFLCFESNVPYVLRFMVDMSMAGGTWVELPPNSYTVRPQAAKNTRQQLEVDVDYEKIISHQPQGEWLKMAPLRVLSFDIECAGRKGFFPQPDMDPVIQIASVLSISSDVGKPIHRAIHTLNTCSPIPGVEVISSPEETGLLKKWHEHFLEADPDVIVGYNICNFDFPYLIDRAKHLKVNSFPYFGRDMASMTRVRTKVFESRALGRSENKEINIEGRIQFDVLVAVRRDYKLVSYTLNAVSAHFLKQQKEDVHHSIITDLQNGNDDTRRRLAEYCVKDAVLPLRLMAKLLFLINYTEMARVTGVPIMFLLQRGQSIKVVSQLLRKARQHHFVIPVMRKNINDDKYEGATVIDPKRGYYDLPIATLDFASLYPSIMMAHNLCYTTYTTKLEVERSGFVLDEDYVVTPNGDYFITQKHRIGLLPEILQELLAARKQAKREMEATQDPFTKAVLNGRQLALKISANSVYGFTGAQVGQLPCLAISSSVTSYGRNMIFHTKEVVEKRYTKANGYEYDAEVIYGDTDSVMVKFGTSDLAESMRLGLEAAGLVSKEFINPIKLEFEKVYFPYLLMAKKRYAGLYWTNTEKWDKIDAKGIETVRRDNCLLVRNVITEALETILVKRSPNLAVENVKRHVSDLLQGKVDLSLLVISKSLAKGIGADSYANKQAHSELALRMRKRDPLSAPNVGDRVPYVITRGAKDSKIFERSEDPLYALENRIAIDSDWYLHHQLQKPLERIFEPILGDIQQLFTGDHTLHVRHSTSATGSILKFAKVTATCMNCRVALKDGQSALCPRCDVNRAEIYLDKLTSVREHEEHYGKLWSQCQRCQGSVGQAVLCESRDCPIFYRRKKVQIDLTDARKELDRFDTEL